jgi:diguanylate cyclase (GGDEF)-like protein
MGNGADPGLPGGGMSHASARPGDVLLIGDASRAFVDAESVRRYPCEVVAGLIEGMDSAARGDFAVVGVVMDGTAGRLNAALKALRQGTRARIVLLAQMHEEPIARRLTEQAGEEGKLADEYLVCPTFLTRLRACAGPGASSASDPSTPPAAPAESLAQVDAARLEQKLRHLEYLATTDDLTSLRNRRYIWEFARQALERAKTSLGRVTLLLFDIDNFKHYNDTYGHLAGDEILRQAGILMRRCCRPHDVVGRVGGDEFAVVFWDDPYKTDSHRERDRRSADTDHPGEAMSVARRFQKEFGNAELPLLGPEAQGVLTISGGLAGFPRDGSTIHELFTRADQALLEAKRDGKNRIYLVGEPQSDITKLG